MKTMQIIKLSLKTTKINISDALHASDFIG